MSFLLGVIIFVLALLVSIMLHELGHFLTAKKFGMKVTQFFVGFGQTLWSTVRGETEYGVKAIPAGGFVKITGMTRLDEVDPADEPRSFRRQPGWQRAIVLVAGSFMHFVLALFLLFVLAVGLGLENDNTTAIGTVDKCVPASAKALSKQSCAGSLGTSPAQLAGLKPGDKVISIGGTHVTNWTKLGKVIRDQKAGQPVPVVIQRDGRQQTLTITPASVPGRSGGYLGIGNAAIFQRVGPVRAVSYAGSAFGQVLTESATGLSKLPAAVPDLFAKDRAKTAAGQIGSVVGAGDTAGQVVAADIGWQAKVAFILAIVISLNIFVGAFNLLPLLPLDGGHLAVVIYERIRAWLARLRGKPDPGLVDMQRLIPVSVGVFALLVGFGLLLIMADIFNPVHLVQ
ncbi:MAG TPA: site-2 protease family protein [Streptosporangiaceae bacterium]|jgi:membrane-associated protease RseP (regulator of RpoE activity)